MTVTVEQLKRRADFLRIAGTRRKYVAPAFVLQIARREDDGHVRIGFTATRKIGNAVVRNRARRRLKEAARAVLPVSAAPGCDYVLVARAGTLTQPYTAILADLQKALGALIMRKAA
jgi:ribonuclease P protein component